MPQNAAVPALCPDSERITAIACLGRLFAVVRRGNLQGTWWVTTARHSPEAVLVHEQSEPALFASDILREALPLSLFSGIECSAL